MKLDGLDMGQLLAEREKIETDPKMRAPLDSLFKYHAAARAKLLKIDYAIAALGKGDFFACGGYSGRQSNKRR